MEYNEVLKYLSGKISSKKRDEFLNWIKNKKNRKVSSRILNRVWIETNFSMKGKQPDLDKMLIQIHQKIEEKNVNSNQSEKWNCFYMRFSQIAAILIIPILLFSSFFFVKYYQSLKISSVSCEHEVYTNAGTRTKIKLSDGTIVWLHDGTTLKYPDKFKKEKREIFIDGEAYLEVAVNRKWPFIVNNPIMKTIVTGTKFNLNAYSSDNFFEATLLEGKIFLQNKNNTYKLNPGQQVRYYSQSGIITAKNINPSISTSWINGKLILENEPLEYAVKKLSRWYNINIVIENPQIKEYMITATIQDENPEQTFKLISMAIPIDYKIKTTRIEKKIRRTVYLKKSSNNN